MFILSTVEADVKVQPKDLNKAPLEAVTEVIEEQYLDKIVADLGLVTSIYDVLDIKGGHIYPNDGAAYFKAKFRLVVFRPFVGEVLVGKLMKCSTSGLKVSLGFFEDVTIPDHALQQPSYYKEDDQVWIWKYEQELYMDPGEDVRFRVAAVRFHHTPGPMQLKLLKEGNSLLGTPAQPFAPMEVLGEINDDGLGLVSWWDPQEEGEEEEGAAAAAAAADEEMGEAAT